MNKNYYNTSGCADPTAYVAVRNVQRNETNESAQQLIAAVKSLIAENGFVLINRIELKDIKNGMVFK